MLARNNGVATLATSVASSCLTLSVNAAKQAPSPK